MRRRILVTGTGRCGTHWMAEAFRAAGIRRVTHEHAFTYHSDGRRFSRRRWRVECSWPAAAYLPVPGAYVVHLVRHPLRTIASRISRTTFSEQPRNAGQQRLARWALEVCPEIAAGTTELERAALHWVWWNRMIEPHARERLMLELTTAEDVTRLARMLRRGALLREEPVPQHTSVEQQALDPTLRPVPTLQWSDVEHVPGLMSMAAEYGYA